MAAVFPLDTSKPWTFNGVTYEYDADDDRWYVISTNRTDFVDDSLESLDQEVEAINEKIEEELENRDALIELAVEKNNQQDAAILELDQRVDAISDASGTLQFKGRYVYALEKSEDACNEVYLNCLIEAGGDPLLAGQCSQAHALCVAAIDEPYPNGSFTSKGATNVMADIEEFIIQGTDLDGQTIDWIGVAEVGDYLEFLDTGDGDTAMYEVIEEPKVFNVQRSIRVKFVRETGLGDSKFNLQSEYTVRVFKSKQGIDIIEADDRYVAKPYTVLFSDAAPATGEAPNGVLRNGELWYDTKNLELFVWNNNAWVTASKPPAQDVVITQALADIDALQAQPKIVSSPNAPDNPRQGDLWFNPSTLKFAFYTGGAWVNPDRS